MKYFIQFSAVFLLLFCSCVPPQQEQPEENTVDSYQDFYDGLSPYGHWVNHPTYGYVWLPEVGADFVPYSTDGYWVYTNYYGWTWVSDYQWGWAPFHYGRWNFEPDYGWYWVPDLTWGPAWVVWRECPGYYGWAPLSPGISFDIAMGGGYMPPEYWWTVCDQRYFGDRDIRHHYEHGEGRGRIIGRESHGVGNSPTGSGGRRNFPTGPSRDDVQRVTGRAVEEIKIEQSARPEQTLAGNNTLRIYRPPFQRIPASQSKPVPRSVTTTRDIHDLRQQSQPQNYPRGSAPPPNTREEPRNVPGEPRQSSPPPREQEPRQQPTPHHALPPQRAPQGAPRTNAQPPSGGRPK